MISTLLTGPAAEPLSLAEAKTHLRVAGTADDDVILVLIRTARDWIERETGLALIDQTWRVTLDAWPACGFVVPALRPLKTLSAARVISEGGVSTALLLADFDVAAAAGSIRVRKPQAGPGRPKAGIELDCVFGFGAAANFVPPALISVMNQLIAFWFENRGDDAAGQNVPETVSRLLAPFRKRRLA
jgi:uncharacterized phiE125 gp8 family phage protein